MQKPLTLISLQKKATSDHDTLLTLIQIIWVHAIKTKIFYDKALEVYKDAYYIYKQYNSKNILYPLRGIASIYAIQEQFEKALKYYQTSSHHCIKYQMTLHGSLSYFVIFPGFMTIKTSMKRHIVIQYALFNMLHAVAIYLLCIFWKGEILHNLNQLDSAFYYINLAKKSSDLKYTGIGIPSSI